MHCNVITIFESVLVLNFVTMCIFPVLPQTKNALRNISASHSREINGMRSLNRRREKAISTYQRAVERNPKEEWAVQGLRSVRTKQGKPGKLRFGLTLIENQSLENNPLLNNLTMKPMGYKRQGERWFAVINEHVPLRLDISLMYTVQHTGRIRSVQFWADGRYLATLGNGTVKISNVSTGLDVALSYDGVEIRDLDISSIVSAQMGNTYLGPVYMKAHCLFGISRQGKISYVIFPETMITNQARFRRTGYS